MAWLIRITETRTYDVRVRIDDRESAIEIARVLAATDGILESKGSVTGRTGDVVGEIEDDGPGFGMSDRFRMGRLWARQEMERIRKRRPRVGGHLESCVVFNETDETVVYEPLLDRRKLTDRLQRLAVEDFLAKARLKVERQPAPGH